MAFLNFKKKEGGLPTDIDLDMPPEPPKMMEEEISTEDPIDEELMPLNKVKNLKKKIPKAKKGDMLDLPPLPEGREFGELPDLPPLPKDKEEALGKEFPPMPDINEDEVNEFPEMPPLPDMEDERLPPPPIINKEKKGFFSFLKPKKAAKELELPKLEEDFPDFPPLSGEEEGGLEKELPDIGADEFDKIPQLPEKEVPLPPKEWRAYARPKPTEPSKPVIMKDVSPPVEESPAIKEVKPIERGTGKRRFVTIDEFKGFQGDLDDIRDSLKEINQFFVKSEEVKNSEDKGYAELHSSLKDIQTKIRFVDKTLFKEQIA